MMMYRFCVDNIGDVVSSQVLLERTLNFSRNRVMDEIIKHNAAFALESLAELAEETVSLCSMQQFAVTRKGYKHRVIQQSGAPFVVDAAEESLTATNRAFNFQTRIRMMNSGSMDRARTQNPHSKQAEQEREVLNSHGLVVIAPPDAAGKSKRAPNIVQKASPAEQPDFIPLPLSELNSHNGTWKSGPMKGMKTTPAERKLLDDLFMVAPQWSAISFPWRLSHLLLEHATWHYPSALFNTRNPEKILPRPSIKPVHILLHRRDPPRMAFGLFGTLPALEVFQFAIFLLRLQKWKKSLMDQLAELSVAGFVKKASDARFTGPLIWRDLSRDKLRGMLGLVDAHTFNATICVNGSFTRCILNSHQSPAVGLALYMVIHDLGSTTIVTSRNSTSHSVGFHL
ncbi:hypothetical protein A0H81_08968 [Grifola frondosa]|uniref:Uncharacterized protein n=1 Tax=Grifola frondosa TaxID=5627 RepID=A0A1C7M2P1_GRIFR|nr:hypothetical protein A0H81_08968 [Grifola frondosa]